MKRKKTTITILKQQRLIAKPINDSVSTWCHTCRDEVLALPAHRAGELLGVSIETLTRAVADSLCHEVGPEQPALICGNSLSSDSTETRFLIEQENE
jgi:hypothetical protein